MQKTFEAIEMSFVVRTRAGPRNHVLDGERQFPLEIGQFGGRRAMQHGASHFYADLSFVGKVLTALFASNVNICTIFTTSNFTYSFNLKSQGRFTAWAT